MAYGNLYTFCSNNFTYFVAVFEYRMLFRDWFECFVHYSIKLQLDSIDVRFPNTVHHDTKSLTFSYYTLDARINNRLNLTVRQLNGRTSIECLYGGITILANMTKKFKSTLRKSYGPSCNASLQEPWHLGNNSIVLPKGIHAILVYAYGDFFLIDVTMALVKEQCEGVFNLCDRIINQYRTTHTPNVYHATHFYVEKFFIAKYSTYFFQDEKNVYERSTTVDITIIPRPNKCFIFQVLREELILTHHVHRCFIKIVPQYYGLIDVRGHIVYNTMFNQFMTPETNPAVRILKTVQNLSVEKTELSYTHRKAIVQNAISVKLYIIGHFGAFTTMGKYAIAINNTVIMACAKQYVSVDNELYNYAACGVIYFQRAINYSVILDLVRLSSSDEDIGIQLVELQYGSTFFYHVIISPVDAHCIDFDVQDSLHVVQIVFPVCNEDEVCITEYTMSAMQLHNANLISFKAHFKIVQMHVIKRLDPVLCPLNISFISAVYVHKKYEHVNMERHCDIYVSSYIF